MAKRRRKRSNGPPPNNGADFLIGEAGPLIYSYPMPPAKSRGQLIPRPEWTAIESGTELAPAEQAATSARTKAPANLPLIPASEEVATLPRAAREAFAARCAARVAPLREGVISPEGTAALILAAATTATPVRRQLLCIRRDFDRLKLLAQQNNWTDDTPVSLDIFGPMWPKRATPDWAKGPPATTNPE